MANIIAGTAPLDGAAGVAGAPGVVYRAGRRIGGVNYVLTLTAADGGVSCSAYDAATQETLNAVLVTCGSGGDLGAVAASLDVSGGRLVSPLAPEAGAHHTGARISGVLYSVVLTPLRAGAATAAGGGGGGYTCVAFDRRHGVALECAVAAPVVRAGAAAAEYAPLLAGLEVSSGALVWRGPSAGALAQGAGGVPGRGSEAPRTEGEHAAALGVASTPAAAPAAVAPAHVGADAASAAGAAPDVKTPRPRRRSSVGGSTGLTETRSQQVGRPRARLLVRARSRKKPTLAQIHVHAYMHTHSHTHTHTHAHTHTHKHAHTHIHAHTLPHKHTHTHTHTRTHTHAHTHTHTHTHTCTHAHTHTHTHTYIAKPQLVLFCAAHLCPLHRT